MAESEEQRDLSDLARSVLYEEIPNQNLMRLTVIVIAISCCLFIGWSAVTNVNEVARSKGEIIPSGYARIVQHLEGGIVADIQVQEGDLVKKGQVLVQVGGIGADEDFSALSRRQLSLRLQAERFKALASGKEAAFGKIAPGDPEAIDNQRTILLAARQAFESEKSVVLNQLAQRKNSLVRLDAEKKASEKALSGAREILKMRTALAKRGNISRKNLIESQIEVSRLEGQVRAEDAKIAEAFQAIREYQNRLHALDVKRKDTALKDLEAVKNQIEQNKETLRKLKQRVNRMTITAPTRGLVKGLRVNTIGAVINSGEAVAEIVPLDEQLIVEVKIPPRDIGNLRIGQLARVKVSAFDFSRYGVIQGTLDFLSATTFTDKDNSNYYKARITLSKGYVGSNPLKNIILPGMTVEVDIITGEKTVLAYLLKPVQRSLVSAFQER